MNTTQNFQQTARAPFLRTSRDFPEDSHNLTIEINKAYIDIANAVNKRIIGIFPTNRPVITGESWVYSQDKRQQTLRQIYIFTATTPIPHGIKLTETSGISRMWGEYTDSLGNWYGLFAATSVMIAGQITFYVTPTQIIFVVSGTAPVLVSGRIVLEWLSDV
jgi:hypothetical protein